MRCRILDRMLKILTAETLAAAWMASFLGRTGVVCGSFFQVVRQPRGPPCSFRLLELFASSRIAPPLPWTISSSNNDYRSRTRRGVTPLPLQLRMASELTKVEISTMRAIQLREGLQNRLREAVGGKGRSTARTRLRPRRSRHGGRGSGGEGVTAETRGASSVADDPALEIFPPGPTAYVLQFDGGSRGNPGPSGAGAVLFRLSECGDREEVWSTSIWLGSKNTCNQAEYTALIEGLRGAKDLGVKRLSVEGDSLLVIRQMLGEYKVSSPKMIPLFSEAKAVATTFEEVNLRHIERALNERADTLANLAMDAGESSAATSADETRILP